MGAMFVGLRLVLLVLAPAACATASPVVPCPRGRASRATSTRAAARPSGATVPTARAGSRDPFLRERHAESLSGEYSDGALSGVWRYRFNDGRNWRADRWEDGALVDKTVDPAVAAMTPAELAKLGPMTSGIIKLASHDALTARESQERGGAVFAAHHPNGRPRVAGRYDADGLRTGVWRFWYEDGRPARELEFFAGVRERAAREWHPNGQLAAEGSYTAGERDGRWRCWDPDGHLAREIVYGADRREMTAAVLRW